MENQPQKEKSLRKQTETFEKTKEKFKKAKRGKNQ